MMIRKKMLTRKKVMTWKKNEQSDAYKEDEEQGAAVTLWITYSGLLG